MLLCSLPSARLKVAVGVDWLVCIASPFSCRRLSRRLFCRHPGLSCLLRVSAFFLVPSTDIQVFAMLVFLGVCGCRVHVSYKALLVMVCFVSFRFGPGT